MRPLVLTSFPFPLDQLYSASRPNGPGPGRFNLGRANSTVITAAHSQSLRHRINVSLESLQKLKAGLNTKLIMVGSTPSKAVGSLHIKHNIPVLGADIAYARICAYSGLDPVAYFPSVEICSPSK